MLTHTEVQELRHHRLSAPSKLPEFDVTKELDVMIAALQEPNGHNLDGDQVTILVLQTLRELLSRTAPRTRMIPISDYEAWQYDTMMTGNGPIAEPYDPVGKTMDFDSAYDA